jgi:hypothetical protein
MEEHNLTRTLFMVLSNQDHQAFGINNKSRDLSLFHAALSLVMENMPLIGLVIIMLLSKT